MEFTMVHIDQMEALIDSRLSYLEAAAQPLSAEEKAQTKEKLAVFFKDHLDRDFFAYAAMDEGNIASVAMLMVYERPFRPDLCTSACIGVVYNVITMEKYRGQGLATGVIKMMLRDAKERKLETVMLNATPAGRGIYKKLGFVEGCYNESNMIYDLEHLK